PSDPCPRRNHWPTGPSVYPGTAPLTHPRPGSRTRRRAVGSGPGRVSALPGHLDHRRARAAPVAAVRAGALRHVVREVRLLLGPRALLARVLDRHEHRAVQVVDHRAAGLRPVRYGEEL